MSEKITHIIALQKKFWKSTETEEIKKIIAEQQACLAELSIEDQAKAHTAMVKINNEYKIKSYNYEN